MSEKETGGPAFPIPLNPGQSWQGMSPCDGMTLRDYFAAKAMQAYMTDDVRWDSQVFEHCATRAYEVADAMLKARKQ